MGIYLAEAGFEDAHCGIKGVGAGMVDSLSNARALGAEVVDLGFVVRDLVGEDVGADCGCQ